MCYNIFMSQIFKKPYLNSFYAEVYILILASAMHFFAKPNTPDTFLDPVIFLSIFVLSASVMGYLFIGEPLQLYLNGEKKQAVSFFLKTVVSFAVITFIVVLVRIGFYN